MNPFDLRGPEFLLFYLLFGAVVLTVLNITRREREDDSVSATISDPYLIAYLRGGERAVVEAAAVALLDRGLMEAVDDEIRAKSIASANRLEEVEKILLEVCVASTKANTLFSHPLIIAACAVYRDRLEQLGLLPDAVLKSRRAADFGIAVLLLGAVAGTKIMVALARGHANIGFLVIFAFVFCFGAYRISNHRRTRKGDRLLTDLTTLFAGLRSRANMFTLGMGGNEAVLVTAAFGAVMLPKESFPFAHRWRPKNAGGSDGGDGGGCGSSSSCGSSCGGGGGGCGGCGS
jgi:uncharacterized protein (TIGR04222 family)